MEITRVFDILGKLKTTSSKKDILNAKENKEWKHYSVEDFASAVNHVSSAFMALGLGSKDVVAIMSDNRIKETGKVKLFRSHNPKYPDGGQMRDFVYVKDVISVIWFLYSSQVKNGIYNLGSGKARTFHDLASATFKAMGKEENIEFIDTPADIRDKYQYFTEAKMDKLIMQGYTKKFTSLEEGVTDYVKNYLIPGKYL